MDLSGNGTLCNKKQNEHVKKKRDTSASNSVAGHTQGFAASTS